MSLIYPCQCRARKELRPAGHCREPFRLLSPWEAGPLTALAPEPLEEAAAAATEGRLLFLRFSN